MKIVSTICRYLLGLVFLVFGLNGFLHFIPQPPPTGLALQFFSALMASHWVVVIFAVQLLGGILLLAGRFVVLGLLLLGPVIVNIVCFHALMAPQGLPVALVVVLLWMGTAWGVRGALLPLFAAKYAGGSSLGDRF